MAGKRITHGTTTLGTVVSLTIAAPFQQVLITNYGANPIFATAGGSGPNDAPAVPTVAGDDCTPVPAGGTGIVLTGQSYDPGSQGQVEPTTLVSVICATAGGGFSATGL